MNELFSKLESQVKASAEEKERVKNLSEIERKWWKNYSAYETADDILKDVEKAFWQKLNLIKNFKLIMRFGNSELKIGTVSSQRHGLSFEKIGEKWRGKIKQANLSDENIACRYQFN